VTLRKVLRQRRPNNPHRRRIERKPARFTANPVRAEQFIFFVCVQLSDLGCMPDSETVDYRPVRPDTKNQRIRVMAKASNFKLQSSIKIRRSQRSAKLPGSVIRLFSRKDIFLTVLGFS
jgi:hypothetical protein